MERFLYRELIKWKQSQGRKPLILNGARQVGKTWLLQEFGHREYPRMAYFACDKTEDVRRVFEADYDIQRIIRQLSALSGVDIHPNDTLIVLDEIQACPRALSALKYFCEDAADYHVAVAGSLLGISLHEGLSFPVGKVDMLRVYPLSFREFLLAMGKEGMERLIAEHDYPSMNTLFNSFSDLLRQYFYVGGMPAAVLTYINGQGLNAVREVQTQILFDYGKDFSKHAPVSQVARINMVWQSVPAQLFKENKKFRYADLKKGGRAAEFELAIQWLIDTGVVHKVTRCREPRMPLKAYEDASAFKLYLVDGGLLGAMVEAPAAQVLIGDNIFKEYRGGFTEQYVYQQLVCANKGNIFYHSAEDSRLEIDFLMHSDNGIVPIEVKAGRNVQSNSLHHYLELHPELHAIRYSMLPYIHQEHLTNIPLFAI